MGLLRWACCGLYYNFFFCLKVEHIIFFFFFKFGGVPNTEEIYIYIYILKKKSGFFLGQGVPKDTLNCKWRCH